MEEQTNQPNQPAQSSQPDPAVQPDQVNQSQAAPVDQPAAKKGYGKRPLWQWVLIYLIVGGVLYAAIYFLYFHKGYNSAGSSTPTQSAPY